MGFWHFCKYVCICRITFLKIFAYFIQWTKNHFSPSLILINIIIIFFSPAAAGLLMVVNILIIMDVSMTLSGKYESIRNHKVVTMGRRALVPMLAVFALISWVFAMVYIMGSAANADTCVETPDHVARAVLQHELGVKGNDQSLVLDFMIYYVDGCPREEFPMDLITRTEGIVDIVENIFSFPELFSEYVEGFLDDGNVFVQGIISAYAGFAGYVERFGSFDNFTVPNVCGTDFSFLRNITEQFQVLSCDLSDFLTELIVFFDCGNWRMLYEHLFYDTVCLQGNEGLHKASVSQFVIALLTMTILTFRAAYTDRSIMIEKRSETDEDFEMDAAKENS